MNGSSRLGNSNVAATGLLIILIFLLSACSTVGAIWWIGRHL